MPALQFDPAQYVKDRVSEGDFAVSRDIFRDPGIFELEMKHIFESTWVFVGMASQVPRPHDFLTTWIGRHPVIVSRDAKGQLHCLLNTCRHRGATVCHTRQGNARNHVCQYHGWVYDSAGKCLDIKDQSGAQYGEPFKCESHDLVEVARFGEYRGLLFASLNAQVSSLDEHLGDARTFIDLVVDQGANGIELIPGVGTYTFRGNWKLQIENCLDNYHLTSTHPSFMKIVERRKSGISGNPLKAIDFERYRLPSVVRGGFTFRHGHAVVWGFNPDPEVRPLFADIDAVRARVGELRAKWMLATRNLTLYPNVQLAENASLQLRVIRPIAPELTEMRIFCMAPVGEAAQTRAYRLRQFEDFFNSSGLATPDDTQSYEDCQTGYRARSLSRLQGHHRGMLSVRPGADQYAQELGIAPETSQHGPFEVQDETVFYAGYREWLRLMTLGAARDGAKP